MYKLFFKYHFSFSYKDIRLSTVKCFFISYVSSFFKIYAWQRPVVGINPIQLFFLKQLYIFFRVFSLRFLQCHGNFGRKVVPRYSYHWTKQSDMLLCAAWSFDLKKKKLKVRGLTYIALRVSPYVLGLSQQNGEPPAESIVQHT